MEPVIGSQLVEKLKKQGLIFSKLTLATETKGTIHDLDWNYKDILHTQYVHNQQLTAIPTLVEDEKIQHIFLLNLFGLFQVPMSTIGYRAAPNSLTYYTTGFFFVTIIDTFYEQLSPNRVRARTEYNIGSAKWLFWLIPLIKWTIKRNYKALMAGDIPMRERKGLLREWGYRFQFDGTPYPFEKTTDLAFENLVMPETPPEFRKTQIHIDQDLPDGSRLLIGKSDHLGLLLTREKEIVKVFPRLCMHEGASLDQSSCSRGGVQCPWHGKLLAPLAELDLSIREKASVSTKFHHLSLLNGTLLIESLQEKETRKDFDVYETTTEWSEVTSR